MSDIFISYAGEDRPRAQNLAQVLEKLGWSVWWDRTIPAGGKFPEVIEEALANARCVLVLWSRVSVKRDWVREEAEEGKQRNVLIPVLLDQVTPPIGFRLIQAADLVGWEGAVTAARLSSLVKDVARVVGPPPTPFESLVSKVGNEARQGDEASRPKPAAPASPRKTPVARATEQQKEDISHESEAREPRMPALPEEASTHESRPAGEFLKSLSKSARRRLALLATFIAAGWAVGVPVGWAVDNLSGWFWTVETIPAALGGLATGLVLRLWAPAMQSKHAILLGIGWAVAGSIAAAVRHGMSPAFGWGVGGAIAWLVGSAIGALATGMVLGRAETGLRFKQVLLIVVGWVLGGGIALTIACGIIAAAGGNTAGANLQFTPSSTFAVISEFMYGPAGLAAGGLFGGGLTLLCLAYAPYARTRQDAD